MSIFDLFRRLDAERAPVPVGAVEFIVVGLGNPGTQYENTRHNAGFLALDRLAAREGFKLKKLRFKSLTAEVVFGGRKCLFMKPTTFMNKSGEAVGEAMRFYKLPPERVIIVYDETAFDVGVVRIRKKGSDGGHNGLKNIILQTGSDAFPRVKIGVGGKPHPEFNLSDWVLSPFKKAEGEALERALDRAGEAIGLMVAGEIEVAMNRFNGN